MKNENIETGIILLIKKAETELPQDVVKALEHVYEIEKGIAKTQIKTVLKNIKLVKKSKYPMCQDTGVQNIFCKRRHRLAPYQKIEGLVHKCGKKSHYRNSTAS